MSIFAPRKAWSKESQALTYRTFEDIRGAEDANHYLKGVTFHRKEIQVQFAEEQRKSKA